MTKLSAFRTIFLLTVLVWPLLGHPPSGIEMTFDLKESILRVTVLHSVNDPARHYINRITVSIGGKEIIRQEFNSQTNDKSQEAVYLIRDVRNGDRIEVTAYCNITGKREEVLEVVFPDGGG